MSVLQSNSKIFVIRYLCTFWMEEKKRLSTRSGYCQHCVCVVCMTSASSSKLHICDSENCKYSSSTILLMIASLLYFCKPFSIFFSISIYVLHKEKKLGTLWQLITVLVQHIKFHRNDIMICFFTLGLNISWNIKISVG